MAHQLYLSLFLSSLLILTVPHSIHAVEYVVTNLAQTTPGGMIFNQQLGVDYTKQTMASATEFIWNLFQQTTDAEKKRVDTVTLFVDDKDDNTIAYAINNEIHVGDNYIEGIRGDIKKDFNGVLYHEMTHIWQWNGNGQGGQTAGNLTEGIADFVRLKADYVPAGWSNPGDGDYWSQGYSVTAWFLDYCNGIRDGFVAELNKKMRDGYNDDFFFQLLGKTVEQLWSDYKALHGRN